VTIAERHLKAGETIDGLGVDMTFWFMRERGHGAPLPVGLSASACLKGPR
jgi:predicted homoserine dehydrogenase-like protein